jgi:predicted RecB family nuclease
MIPIEIKSHKDVTVLDELELAFYWMLLDPMRTRRRVKPRGVVVLRQPGSNEPRVAKVPLSDERLDQVRALVSSVRAARRKGVTPLMCHCNVCSNLCEEDVMASLTSRQHVSLVWGVGRRFSYFLESMGYDTFPALLKANPAELADAFRAAGYRGVSEGVVTKWQLHAQSLQSSKPAFRQAPDPLHIGERYIALDLEYGDWVWLFGACLVDGKRRRHFTFWANDIDEGEEAGLAGLLDLCERHQNRSIVTWGGTGADFPQLVRAAERHGMAERLELLRARHVDAFQWAKSNYRAPISRLGIKYVSEYLGYRRRSDVMDGLEALAMFSRYRRTHDEAMKRRLIAYCRDDVNALIYIVGKLRDGTSGRGVLDCGRFIPDDLTPAPRRQAGIQPPITYPSNSLTERQMGLQPTKSQALCNRTHFW